TYEEIRERLNKIKSKAHVGKKIDADETEFLSGGAGAGAPTIGIETAIRKLGKIGIKIPAEWESIYRGYNVAIAQGEEFSERKLMGYAERKLGNKEELTRFIEDHMLVKTAIDLKHILTEEVLRDKGLAKRYIGNPERAVKNHDLLSEYLYVDLIRDAEILLEVEPEELRKGINKILDANPDIKKGYEEYDAGKLTDEQFDELQERFRNLIKKEIEKLEKKEPGEISASTKIQNEIEKKTGVKVDLKYIDEAKKKGKKIEDIIGILEKKGNIKIPWSELLEYIIKPEIVPEEIVLNAAKNIKESTKQGIVPGISELLYKNVSEVPDWVYLRATKILEYVKTELGEYCREKGIEDEKLIASLYKITIQNIVGNPGDFEGIQMIKKYSLTPEAENALKKNFELRTRFLGQNWLYELNYVLKDKDEKIFSDVLGELKGGIEENRHQGVAHILASEGYPEGGQVLNYIVERSRTHCFRRGITKVEDEEQSRIIELILRHNLDIVLNNPRDFLETEIVEKGKRGYRIKDEIAREEIKEHLTWNWTEEYYTIYNRVLNDLRLASEAKIRKGDYLVLASSLKGQKIDIDTKENRLSILKKIKGKWFEIESYRIHTPRG
ncbi:MAG: hypothetical protein KAU03_01705, partial [Candidatus Altiarchaeales archaeon]|nr:hypothetical protein [Candidatus Altiarchaeales archaeon]